MRYVHCILLIALCLLAGCGTPDSQQSAGAQITAMPTTTPAAPAAPTASPAAPTPTQPAPTATFIPTSAPAPTTQPTTPTTAPAPTVAPPTPTTVLPTAAPQPTAPAEFIVVSGGEVVVAIAPDGSTRPIEIEGIELRMPQVVTSADGSWIAGPIRVDEGTQRSELGLVLYNISSGERKFLPQSGTVSHLHFSPDNTSLIFTVQNWEPMTWQVNILDLKTNRQRTLLEGVDDRSLGLVPSDWTPEGILAYKHLVFGADAGPEGLYLINPGDGSIRTLIPDGFTGAVASPDGKQIAIIQGSFGFGIEDPTASLSILDLASGETRIIEQEQAGYPGHLSWSPDGAKLLHQQPLRAGMADDYVIVGPAITEPMRFTLPVARENVRHLSWRNSDTLVLLVEEGDRDTLYELPIATPDASNLKQLASIASPGQHTSTIVYIAR